MFRYDQRGTVQECPACGSYVDVPARPRFTVTTMDASGRRLSVLDILVITFAVFFGGLLLGETLFSSMSDQWRLNGARVSFVAGVAMLAVLMRRWRPC